MADLSDYSSFQQKVINEIISNDKNFHNTYMIGDMPFYSMLVELENGTISVLDNISVPLSAGGTEYTLQLFYSSEQECWFFELEVSGEQVSGVVHYNTVYNAKGEVAFAILNDNETDTNLYASLPYSNILVMRK